MNKLEFQLAAHRELLIGLLGIVRQARPEEWQSLLGQVEDDLVVKDHEEDPGVVPSEAFAAQNALSEELQAILHAVQARFGEDHDQQKSEQLPAD